MNAKVKCLNRYQKKFAITILYFLLIAASSVSLAINSGSDEKNMLLLRAIKKCDLQETEKVLIDEANPNADIYDHEGSTSDYMSSLSIACLYCRSNEGMVELLLKYGADVNKGNGKILSPLMIAVNNELTPVIKIMVKRGADVNQAAIDNSLITPLIKASMSGYVDIVEILLANHAKIDAQDGSGDTAIMSASRHGHKEVVKKLLDQGANINKRNYRGDVALRLVLSDANGKVNDVVQNLYSAASNMQNTIANNGKNIPYENMLLILNKLGDTVIKIAGANDDMEIAEMLIEKGANVKVKNEEGETPLMVAAQIAAAEGIVERLLQKGADINSINNQGDTALILAVSRGLSSMASMLLKHGANVGIVNGRGETALSIAEDKGFTDIVTKLQEYQGDSKAKEHKHDDP